MRVRPHGDHVALACRSAVRMSVKPGVMFVHAIAIYTQVLGFLQASSSSNSGEPGAGWWSYSQPAVLGRDMRMDSMRPPVFRPKVVPRS